MEKFYTVTKKQNKTKQNKMELTLAQVMNSLLPNSDLN